jgi:hypothetical protein
MSEAEAYSGRSNHEEEAVCNHKAALIAVMALILRRLKRQGRQ